MSDEYTFVWNPDLARLEVVKDDQIVAAITSDIEWLPASKGDKESFEFEPGQVSTSG